MGNSFQYDSDVWRNNFSADQPFGREPKPNANMAKRSLLALVSLATLPVRAFRLNSKLRRET